MKLDIEKLMKNLKDASFASSMQMRHVEEDLARKKKEVECLVKEKKCRNCVLCLDDSLKEKEGANLVQELNDRLMAKTKRVEQLEEQARKGTHLLNQVCQQNFQFLR